MMVTIISTLLKFGCYHGTISHVSVHIFQLTALNSLKLYSTFLSFVIMKSKGYSLCFRNTTLMLLVMQEPTKE